MSDVEEDCVALSGSLVLDVSLGVRSVGESAAIELEEASSLPL